MPLCGHSDTKLLFLHILIANLYKQKETTKQLHKMPIDQETVVYGSFVKATIRKDICIPIFSQKVIAIKETNIWILQLI